MSVKERLERVFPWGVDGGIRSMVLSAVAGFGLILVWLGTADRGVFADQVGWLSAGIALLVVSLYAHTSMILRARRALGERRERLINDRIGTLVSASFVLPLNPEGADEDPATVVVVRGLNLFHHRGCAMTHGRDVLEVRKVEAIADGLAKCGICSHQEAANPTATVRQIG